MNGIRNGCMISIAAWIVIFMAALALVGCGPRVERPEPEIRIVEVKVPVVRPCDAAAAIGPAPAYPDTDQAISSAPNLYERVKLLLAGRVLRIEREATATAALEACK